MPFTLAKYDAIPAIASPGAFPPGNLGIPFPEPPPLPASKISFSAVPRRAVPGHFTIGGFSGPSGSSYYQYIGHPVLSYLDYVDTVISQLLTAHPGNIYAMLPVNNRAGLTDPPPDGRWGIPSGAEFEFEVIFPWHIEPSPPPEVLALDALDDTQDMLARARLRNANLQAVAARG